MAREAKKMPTPLVDSGGEGVGGGGAGARRLAGSPRAQTQHHPLLGRRSGLGVIFLEFKNPARSVPELLAYYERKKSARNTVGQRGGDHCLIGGRQRCSGTIWWATALAVAS